MAILSAIRQRIAEALNRQIFRDGYWIVGGHLTTIVAGIIGIRVLTELAPASVFGGASLLLGMMTLALSVLLAPLTQTQVRYHLEHRQRGDADAYNRLMGKYAAICAAVFSIATITVLLAVPSLRAGAGFWILATIAPWVLGAAARGMLIGPLQAERRMQRYAMWVASEAILLVVCTAVAMGFTASIEAYVIGQTTAIWLAVLIFGRFPAMGRDSARRPIMAASVQAEVRAYGMPFVSFAVLAFVYGQADRYVLAATLDTAAVGQYVAAFAIASRLPTLVGGIMTDVFRPALFEAESTGNGDRGRQIFRLWMALMVAAMALMLIGVFIFGDLIAWVVLAPDYRLGARDVMVLVALGYGCAAMAQVIEIRLLSFSVSAKLILPRVVGGCANIGFALLLIPMFGAWGAGLANAIGQALILIAVGVTLALTSKRKATNCVANSHLPPPM